MWRFARQHGKTHHLAPTSRIRKCEAPEHGLLQARDAHRAEVVEDSDLGGDGEEEVDESQVVLAVLEDFGRRRRLAPAASAELLLRPPGQLVRAGHGDEGLDEHDLHELADEPFLGQLYKVVLV